MTTQVSNTPQSRLTAGDADTTFALLTGSDGSVIMAGNGNNQIFVFSNNDVITSGSGSNTLLAQTTGSVITLGAGFAFVFGNNDQVTVNGTTQVVSVNGTSNMVTVGNQSSTAANPTLLFGQGNTYTLGTGNFGVYDTGMNTKITAGAGSTTVVGTQGSASISLGNGNDLIGAGGTGNTIFIGAGNSTVFAGSGNDQVAAGNGNDTFVLGGTGSTLALGSGKSVVFLAGVGNNTTTLYDTSSRIDFYGFDAASRGGDLVRLGVALHTTTLSVLQSLVNTTFSGNDTLLNTTGGATLVDFHGIGQQSLSQLIANHLVTV